MDKNGTEKFLLGMLIGGIIGAGVALLFAPASGKETREYIKRQFDTAVESGKKFAQKVGDEFAQRKEAISEAVRTGKEAYSQKMQE